MVQSPEGYQFDTSIAPKGRESIIREKITGSFIQFVFNGTAWEITHFSVAEAYQNKGIGQRLIHEFVTAVGLGKPVYGQLIDELSGDQLKAAGYYEKAAATGELEIKDPKRLESLKFFHVLDKGGVRIDRLMVHAEELFDGGSPVEGFTHAGKLMRVELFAHTKR